MTHSIRGTLARCLASLLLLACSWGVDAAHTPQSVPNPRPVGAGHMANPDEVIDAEHAIQIERLLTRLEADKGVQIAVVAVSNIESPADVFEFSQQLFERWGIGDRARDDGLLVLLVRDQRTIRMHTGHGLEGLLPDLLCHRIEQQFMKPAFKAGRYGEGLLAGLTEVDRVLRSPAAADQAIAALVSREDGWRSMRWVLGVPIVLIGMLLFAVRSMRGYFARESNDSGLPPVSMRYSRLSWLSCFMVLPLAILLVAGEMPIGLRVGGAIVLLYAYFVLMAMRQAWRLRGCARALFANQEHVRLHRLLGQQRTFWVWMAIWMPLPFAAYLPYLLTLRRRYRRRARPCEACGQPTRLLSEQEEDAHLPAARQTEERLGSVDHDVWLCGGCGAVQCVGFPNDDAAFQHCPACNAVALGLESDTVLKAATASRQGQGVRKFVCRHCRHQHKETYAIARVQSAPADTASASSASSSSDSSSSGSSSSASSSDWGGGSTGGGGASSTW